MESSFWKDCPSVESVAGRVSGRAVVKGTRMPADDVVANYESGSPVEEIAENFGLKEAEIRAILAYAALHLPAKLAR
jgi:uncharacterized protein (DUF433 family)